MNIVVDHEKNKRRSKIVLPVAFLNTLSNADSIDFSSTNDICIPYILSLSLFFSLVKPKLHVNKRSTSSSSSSSSRYWFHWFEFDSKEKALTIFIIHYMILRKKNFFFYLFILFQTEKKPKLSIQIQIWIRSNIKLILKIQKDIIFYSKFESIFYFILSFESLRMNQNEREIHFWWNLNRILSRCDIRIVDLNKKKKKKTFFLFFFDKNLPKITHICRVSSCHHENRSIFENKIS